MRSAAAAEAPPAAPARRPRWRPSPYLVVSAVAVFYAAALAARQPWGGDFGLHAAVVGRLRADLLHPGDPMVDAYAPSPYVTPYTVVLALVAKVTGGSAAAILSAAAPVNLALLLYGLRRFVGLFTPSRWAPVLALAFVVLLWGPAAPRWSGFPNLDGLLLVLPYPSTVALALALLSWVLVDAALRAPPPALARWLGVGALGATIALIHPFTAICAALGAAAVFVGRGHRRALPGVAAAAAVAVLIVLAWPYFRAADLPAAAGELDAIHAPLYAEPVRGYGPALVIGLPAVVLRLRRDHRDPLAWLSVFAGAVVGAGWLTGAYALGRAWPVALLALQVAAAVELARPALPRAARIIWGTAAAAACLVGLVAMAGNLLLVLPRADVTAAQRRGIEVSTGPDVRWAASRLLPGDVVLTGDTAASRALLAYEVRFVAPPWPDPLLADEGHRVADRDALLAPGTEPARRRELLDRYGVRWVLDRDGAQTWADPYAVEVVDGPGGARLLRLP